MKLAALVRYGFGVGMALAVNACTATTPHENFNRNLQMSVGAVIDTLDVNIQPSLLVSEKKLQNGNLEYRYKWYPGCVRIFEVDPATRVILRADFEGDQESCILPP